MYRVLSSDFSFVGQAGNQVVLFNLTDDEKLLLEKQGFKTIETIACIDRNDANQYILTEVLVPKNWQIMSEKNKITLEKDQISVVTEWEYLPIGHFVPHLLGSTILIGPVCPGAWEF